MTPKAIISSVCVFPEAKVCIEKLYVCDPPRWAGRASHSCLPRGEKRKSWLEIAVEMLCCLFYYGKIKHFCTVCGIQWTCYGCISPVAAVSHSWKLQERFHTCLNGFVHFGLKTLPYGDAQEAARRADPGTAQQLVQVPDGIFFFKDWEPFLNRWQCTIPCSENHLLNDQVVKSSRCRFITTDRKSVV